MAGVWGYKFKQMHAQLHSALNVLGYAASYAVKSGVSTYKVVIFIN